MCPACVRVYVCMYVCTWPHYWRDVIIACVTSQLSLIEVGRAAGNTRWIFLNLKSLIWSKEIGQFNFPSIYSAVNRKMGDFPVKPELTDGKLSPRIPLLQMSFSNCLRSLHKIHELVTTECRWEIIRYRSLFLSFNPLGPRLFDKIPQKWVHLSSITM